MSLEAHLRALVREEITAALAAFEPKTKAAGKKAAATESVQPAATPAAAPAQAPAAAPPAQSPAAPTPPPPLTDVNKATQALAQVDRQAAVDILTKFGATFVKDGKTLVNTAKLATESYQSVIDAMEEKKASIDAAATQVSLV